MDLKPFMPQARYATSQGTMTKWAVQKRHRTAQKHAEYQDAIYMQEKVVFFVYFFGFFYYFFFINNFLNNFSKT